MFRQLRLLLLVDCCWHYFSGAPTQLHCKEVLFVLTLAAYVWEARG